MKSFAVCLLPVLFAGALCGQPVLKFDTQNADLGEIAAKGGTVVRTFAFVNTGDAPLVLSKADVSCTCTKVRLPHKPTAPGGKDVVTVIYDPRRQEGTFHKAIRISANTETKKHVVTIRGTVVP